MPYLALISCTNSRTLALTSSFDFKKKLKQQSVQLSRMSSQNFLPPKLTVLIEETSIKSQNPLVLLRLSVSRVDDVARSLVVSVIISFANVLIG